MRMMDAEKLVLAVLGTIPSHEVRGKKRLQKLAFFAVNKGANSDVRYFLHDFGPFSPEVANATDFLSCVGEIAESEAQFSKTKRYMTVYRLANPSSEPERLPKEAADAIKQLNEYTTLELEIASTVLYFLRDGHSLNEAVDATKQLKPSKSLPKVIQRAQEALSKVGLYERGRAYPVPGSRSNQF